MKSIKPGRGPSFMSFIGSVCMAAFGLLWTIIAFAVTSNFGGIVSLIFPLFGVVFIVIAISNAIYSYKNATGKNRYSSFDITTGSEEPDPLNIRFGDVPSADSSAHSDDSTAQRDNEAAEFCPYCGTKVQKDYIFCNSCGKKLP